MAKTELSQNAIQTIAKRIAAVTPPYELHSGQKRLIRAMFEEGKRRILVVAGRSWGKAESIQGVVPTPDGFRLFGDLRQGDSVFAPDGSVTKIVAVGPILLGHPTKKVTFIDGTTVVCHAEHEWLTLSKSARKHKKPSQIVETQEIQQTLLAAGKRQENNHFVKSTEPIQLPHKNLPIDPYLLGVWLGDGTSAEGKYSKPDPFLAEEIRRRGYLVEKCSSSTPGKCPAWKIEGLKHLLQVAGLINNKHIPHEYLWASHAQRLDLLRGLMDTDGYADSHACNAEFSNTRISLIEGVEHLCRSLGMKTTRSKAQATFQNGGIGKEAWRVSITPNEQLFLLPRKAERLKNWAKVRAANYRAIINVEDVPSEPMRCIQVEHESGMYLTGKSFIPTHNSAVSMFATARLMCLPGKKCFIVGPTRKQQKEIMWEQEDGIKSFFPERFQARMTEAEQRIELPWGSSCKIDGSEMHQAFRGVAYDLMVLDEAQDQDWRFYDASYPNLSKKNGILLVIGTLQQDMSNPFMKKWQEALNDPSWCVINAPSWENEKIRPWLEEEKAKYFARGDEAEWIREFEAKYATGGNRAVFKPFKPALHVKPLDVLQAHMAIRPYEWEYWTVSDPGTKSVFAVTFHALNRATSEAFQLAEIYETDQNLTTPRQIWGATLEIEKRIYPPNAQVNRVYDEAAAWFSTVIASEFGVGMMPTTKDSREKMDDFGVMKDSMLAGKWCYAEDCVRTIAEVGGYRVKSDGSIDEKAPDHAIDCNRYFVRMANYTVAVHYTNRDIITREINRRLGVDELAPGEPDGIEDVETDLELWG